MLDPFDIPSFNLRQNRMNLRFETQIMKYSPTMPVTLYAFDFLYPNDRKLIRSGREERKSLLKSILIESSSLKYSNHVEMDGESFYDTARECMKFWRKAGS